MCVCGGEEGGKRGRVQIERWNRTDNASVEGVMGGTAGVTEGGSNF